MEFALALALRLLVGMFLASLLGMIGYFVGWFIAPPRPGMEALVQILAFTTGTGAGLGGALGWLKADDTLRSFLFRAALALLGGLGGGWAGLWYGIAVYEDGVMPPSAVTSMIMGAVVAANVAPLLEHLLRSRSRRKSHAARDRRSRLSQPDRR
ncbi:MAG: hypothetical protein Q8O40_11705 [Chloroflexota bacterium]|nr:hypothetical protein [Chloroflexota bacterium]